MIIQNLSTVYPNTYLRTDDIVIDISSRLTLREIYEKLEAGEDLSDVVVFDAYKRTPDEEAVPNFIPHRPPFLEESEFGDKVSVAEFEGFLHGKAGYEDSFERIPIILSNHVENAISKPQLMEYLAYAMEILPELETKKNLSLQEMLRLSETAKMFYKNNEPISAFNPLPSYEDLMLFSSLSAYEQRIFRRFPDASKALALVRYCKDEKANGIGQIPLQEAFLSMSMGSPELMVREATDFDLLVTHGFSSLPNEFSRYLSALLVNHELNLSGARSLNNVIYNYYHQDSVSEETLLSALTEQKPEPIKKYLNHAGCFLPPQTMEKILNGEQSPLPAEIEPVIETYLNDSVSRFFTRDRLTPDALNAFIKEELKTLYPQTKDNYELILEQKFQEKFHRVPRVLHQILRAYQLQKGQLTLTPEKLDDIVKNFHLKSFQTIVNYHSANLMNLSRYLDFSTMKTDHLEIFKVKDLNVDSLKYAGFFDWYNAHKDVNASELWELLEEDIQYYAITDTAKEILKKTKLKTAYAEVEKFRTGCHIDFEKNDVAVKGRDIIVSNQNFTIEICDKDDPRQASSGIDTHCCQHYGGAGQTCVEDILTNPLSCNLIITDNQTGKIVAQSYVWSDISKDALVLDNMEFEPSHDKTARKFFPLIAKWCEQMPHKNIHIGTGYNQSFKGVGIPVTQYTGCDRTALGAIVGRAYWYSDYHKSGTNVARALKVEGAVTLSPDEHATVTRKPLIPSALEEACPNPEDYRLLSLSTIRDVEDIKTFKEKAAACTDETWVRSTIQKLISNDALSLLKMFSSVPEDLQESIFASDQSAVQYIKNPTKSVLQKYLTLNPFMVSQYPDIDEELLKHLYSKNGLLVRKAPTKNLECQRAAVKNEPLAILYLKDSEIFDELLMSAITKTPDIIKFFPNADNKFWNKAIYRNPYLIRYKSNPTKWQKETAITNNPAVVYSIKDAKKEDFVLAKNLLKKYRTPIDEQASRTENEQFNPFARM